MKATNHKIVITLLLASILLTLLFLLAETFLPAELFISRLIHFATVICLCLVLFMTSIDVRYKRNIALASHARAMAGMQRKVDKTVRRYTSLLEGAGNAIFVFNADSGMLEEVNRQGMELLGYSKEEMTAMRGKDLIPPDEQKQFMALLFRVKRHGRCHFAGLTFQRKNGVCFTGEVEARLIDLGSEKVVHAIVRDITQNRRYLRELRQRNHELIMLNSILASTNSDQRPEAVLDVTLRETLELFGAEGGAIHLLAADGKTLHVKTAKNIPHCLQENLAIRELETETHCRIAASQRCHVLHDLERAPCPIAKLAAAEGWQSVSVVPLAAKNRLIGVMHITHRHAHHYTDEELRFLATIGNQAGLAIEQTRLFAELNWQNEELLRSYRLLEKSSHRLSVSQSKLSRNLALVEQANLELERLDRMKSHFLGMVSHEFNTPLTGILGGVELLISNQGSFAQDEERRILEMIQVGGARLHELVSDLLKTAKLEAKMHSLTKTPLHLARIVEIVHEQLKPLLQERTQTIVFGNLAPLPYFSGDPDYLEEVFGELLGNAMKFTPDGGEIVLTGRVVASGELARKKELLCRFNQDFYEQISANCYLEVEVRDSGIGIDAGEQLKIFEKFYEVGEICHHSSSKHKFQGKGTGLGLAIVKGMVEAHNGMVWVESSADEQSDQLRTSFFLLLPLEECPDQPALPFGQRDVVTSSA
jgi:PAS domain S-box-containing protein